MTYEKNKFTALALTLCFSLGSLSSCKKAVKDTNTIASESTPAPAVSVKKKKTKVGNNTYPEARQRTLSWFKSVDFDIDLLVEKKYNLQKHFAEYLGLGRLLYQTAATDEEKKDIKNYIVKAYDFTLKPSYHNLEGLDAKTFKANSMSYLRILFLLNEFGFDTQYYSKQVAKIQSRLDTHLAQRGDWQKWAFDNYYNALNLKKPAILNGIASRKGLLRNKIPAEKYTLNNAYELTHLVFAAYNYGANKTQNKFSMEDLDYIANTLDLLSKKYRAKNNRDILSELVTSMELINSHTQEFKAATTYLLRNQNHDGTWGNYEKARSKYGDLV